MLKSPESKFCYDLCAAENIEAKQMGGLEGNASEQNRFPPQKNFKPETVGERDPFSLPRHLICIPSPESDLLGKYFAVATTLQQK